MKNCMVDLETLGKRPGAVVLSIGACMFDEMGVGATYYTVLNTLEQVNAGAHIDPSTVEWWNSQSESARAVLQESEQADPVDVVPELSRFKDWWRAQGAQFVWGNGAAFDDPILTETYRLFGMAPPWKFWDSRCHRTLKAMYPAVKAPPFEGTKHRADADAAHQALHASLILRHIRHNELRVDRGDVHFTGHNMVESKGLATDAAADYSARVMGEDTTVGAAIARIRKEKQ